PPCGAALTGAHARACACHSPGRAEGGASVTEDTVCHGTPRGRPLTSGKGGPHRGGAAHATAAPRVYPLSMRDRWHFPQSLLCQSAAFLSCPPLEAALWVGGGSRGGDGMLLAFTK